MFAQGPGDPVVTAACSQDLGVGWSWNQRNAAMDSIGLLVSEVFQNLPESQQSTKPLIMT